MRRLYCVGLVAASWLVAVDSGATPKRFSTAIRCSRDEAGARAAIEALDAARDTVLELPPSADRGGYARRASVADVDEVLLELSNVRQRFPALAVRAESVVLGYRYCAMFDGAVLWDVVANEKTVFRTRPRAMRARWNGFEAWGFLQPAGPPPSLVRDGPLGHDQRGWFLGELASERCFPHPIFGADRERRPEFERVGDDLAAADANVAIATEEPCDVVPSPAFASVAAAAPRKVPAPPKAPPSPPHARFAAHAAAPGSALGASMVTANDASGLGFSGRFVVDGKLNGAVSAGAGISYSPRAGYFARVGLSQALGKGQEGTSYSYGIGYDDWHEGSFSAQLNDWGPRSFESRPNLASAAVDFGYKVPLPKFVGKWMACAVSLNFPFSAAPGSVLSVSIKPFGDFYVSGGLRMSPFSSTFGTWFYAFGFSSYHPFTFGLAYANWGPNKAFVPNFENGSIVGTFSWAL